MSISATLAALGVKLTSIVAGFAGGVVSLSFIQGLTRTLAVSAVVVSTLTAAFLTPAVVGKLDLGPQFEGGSSFIIGLCAMSIVPLIRTTVPQFLSGWFRRLLSWNQGDGGAK